MKFVDILLKELDKDKKNGIPLDGVNHVFNKNHLLRPVQRVQLQKILLKLPQNVAQYVNKVLFVSSSDKLMAATLTLENLSKVATAIVWINPQLWANHEQLDKAVLHEIAHIFLRHKSLHGLIGEQSNNEQIKADFRRQEEEANKQVQEWIKNAESSDG